MLNCFKKPRDRGAPAPVRSNDTALNPQEVQAYFFFVGHQDAEFGNDYGTRSYNHIKEQPANKMLANRLANTPQLGPRPNNAPVHVVLRPYGRGDYDKYCDYAKSELKRICKEEGYDIKKVVCIELHFNAASIPEARGVEAWVSEHRSALFASPIVNAWSLQFGIVKREHYNYTETDGTLTKLRGVKMSQTANGTGWIKAINSTGAIAILWEPFFCDYRTRETEQFFGNNIDFFKNDGLPKMVNFWMGIVTR